MSQDVTQWLAEVQSLQRQVSELAQARDQAYASADNLRRMYEAEATQRRRESENYSRKIEQLQQALAEAQVTQSESTLASETGGDSDSHAPANHLKAQLMAAQQQCEQFKTLLEAEQAEHRQTRESLTAALGDAVDLLAKERPNLSLPKSEQGTD